MSFDDISKEHERIYRVYILKELKLAKDNACKFASDDNKAIVANILKTTVLHMRLCNQKYLSNEDKNLLKSCEETVNKKLSFYKEEGNFDVFIEGLADEVAKQWWTIRENKIKLRTN